MSLARLFPLVRPVLHLWFRWSRGLTLGVRAAVLDGEGRVFLVRHGYVAGWHLPGGGVEVGETAAAALRRELGEEAGLEPIGVPRLHGIFHSGPSAPRDHVLLYEVRRFRVLRETRPNREIAEAGFFAADRLPQGVTDQSRAWLNAVASAGTGHGEP